MVNVIVCKSCNIEFKSRKKTSKTCSVVCAHQLMKKNDIPCEECEKMFHSCNKARFCSRNCSAIHNNRIRAKEVNKKISLTLKARGTEVTKFASLAKKIAFNNKIKEYEISPKKCKHCQCSIPFKRCKKETCIKCCRKNVGGYRPGAGQSKHGWYKNIWCDSLYELSFVIYNIDHGIEVIRNTKGYPYQHADGSNHLYFPDFIIDGKLYEIKGLMRENDSLKHDAVDVTVICGKKENEKYISYAKQKFNLSYERLIEAYDKSRYIYKKICGVCEKEFETHRENAKLCSQSCSMKNAKMIYLAGKSCKT